MCSVGGMQRGDVHAHNLWADKPMGRIGHLFQAQQVIIHVSRVYQIGRALVGP
jgi:hypothetical protein